MMPLLLLRLALAAIALMLVAPTICAQNVQVAGGDTYRATQILQQILDRGEYLVLDRDTVLPDDFRATGDLVIADADVRLEGEVEGDVAVVQGAFFIRPGGRVRGTIVSVGGEVFPSGLAEVGEILELPPEARTVFTREGEVFQLQVRGPSRDYSTLPGIFGVRLPTYDRVNGISLGWGAQWRITGREGGAAIAPWLTYYTARGEFGGGAEAVLPLAGGVEVSAAVASTTVTNDAWIRGDLANSLAALAAGSDLRNYHHSELVSVSLARPDRTPLIAGEFAFSPRVRLLISRDRSLPARETWALFGGGEDWRPNPPIARGTVGSVSGGAELRWQGSSTAFQGDVSVERALSQLGDFEFAQWIATGAWQMRALRQHSISVMARGMGAFGATAAPPQRWSFVGGANTLPTLETAEFRGDNLVFVQSVYGIPVTAIVAPVIGSPVIELVHAIGTAWVTGSDPRPWEQNLAVGARFSFIAAHVYIDPADPGAMALAAGLVLPAF
jgi:hypothetical protein